MNTASILVVNAGSSSLKFGLYDPKGTEEEATFEGQVDGIASESGSVLLRDARGEPLASRQTSVPDQETAIREAISTLSDNTATWPSAIGHRVVHGGPRLTTHQRITPELLLDLEACVHFAPIHIPAAVQLIRATESAYRGVPQFACFDTAFHRSMPETATRLAIPEELFNEGIRRYGFHGISYESILHQLGQEIPPRLVIAHLGSGASLVAVRDGKSVDTTMGLTPTGGIPMATRPGDLDPGVLLYLMRARKADADSLERMLNTESGIKALSGRTNDMRQLESLAAGGNERADLAIRVFCLAIAKSIAAYAAVLNGLDLLVFSGGIGENSSLVRRTVCGHLAFMGVSLEKANEKLRAGTISKEGSAVRVSVFPSQEDKQIARHCRAMLDNSKI